MKLDDFERYKKLTPADGDKNWEALDDLSEHLNDHLLLVEKYKFPQFSPCRMVGFQAKDKAKTQLYALAMNEGKIIVGKAERLKEYKELDLADFEPRDCEVINLAISGQDYFLGDHLNLWVSVRHPSSETDNKPYETLIYHALVNVNKQGKINFTPARDDSSLQKNNFWQGLKVEEAPVFFKTWNYSSAYGKDPFLMTDETTQFLEEDLPKIDTVNSIEDKICYTSGRKIFLAHSTEAKKVVNLSSLRERVNCLALRKHKNNEILGIAGCNDRLLVSFREDEKGTVRSIKRLWSQSQDSVPMAISFIEHPKEDLDTEEILIIFKDGSLHRLHYIKGRAIRYLWNQCWRNLLPVNKIEAMNNLINFTEQQITVSLKRREVVLYKLLSLLLASKLIFNPPKEYPEWLKKIDSKGLFMAVDGAENLPDSCFSLLIKWLEKFSTKNKGRLSVNIDYFSQFLYHIYDKQLSLNDKRNLDYYLNLLTFYPENQENERLKRLQQRAKISIHDIYKKSKPATTNALLKHTDIALEYYYHKFLRSSKILFNDSLDEQGLADLLSINVKNRPYLLILRQQVVTLYSLQTEDSRQKEISHFQYTKKTDLFFTQLLTLYENNKPQENSFLLVNQSGDLRIINLNKGSLKLNLAYYEKCSDRTQRPYYIWTATSCPAKNGGTLVAITGGQGRRAILILYHVIDNKLNYLSKHQLQIPWVSCLDIALTKTGYSLVAATDQSPVTILYALNQDATKIAKSHVFQVLRHGTCHIRFDKKINPSYLLSGGYAGILWCANIINADCKVIWSYQLKAPVRCIQTLLIEHKIYFLVGSGKGELCIISTKEGKRYWKIQLSLAIRHIAVSKQNLLTIARSDGVIKVFEKSQDMKESAAYIKNNLDSLNRLPIDKINNHYISLLVEIKKNPEAIVEIFKKFEGFGCKSKLICYLVNSEQLTLNPEIIDILNFHEIALLLADLPEKNINQLWVDKIWKKVTEESVNLDINKQYDNEVYFAKIIIVRCLQNLSRLNTNLEDLINKYQNNNFIENSTWVGLEYARLLIKKTLQNHPEQKLLLSLAPHLLTISPSLINKIHSLFPLASDNQLAFFALEQLVQNKTLNNKVLLRHLEQLNNCFQARQNTAILKFLSSLTALHLSFHEYKVNSIDEEITDWDQERKQVLTKLHNFIQLIFKLKNVEPKLNSLIISFRHCLIDDPMPKDTDRLKQQLEWVERATRKFKIPKREEPIKELKNWQLQISRLLSVSQNVIQQILNLEHQYLIYLVRPYLMFSYCQHQIGNKIKLALNVQAEGDRQLKDVTIQISAAYMEGLMSPGCLTRNLNYENYQESNEIHTIILDGFIKTNQKKIAVQSLLEDGVGYKNKTTWYFAIPKKNSTQDFYLDNILPTLYQKFKNDVFNSEIRVIFAVCDQELGYGHFIRDWNLSYPNQQLDLDLAIENIGIGRLYSATKLDIYFIKQQFENAQNNQKRLLVAPVDSLLQRLIDDDDETLKSFCSYLKQRSEDCFSLPLILLISSEHAAYLRRLGLGNIKEICVHQVLIDEYQRHKPLLKQCLELIRERTEISVEQAKKITKQLGFDLRLILRWLLEKQLKSRPFNFESFLAKEAIKDIIFSELKALNPFELIHILVASQTTTHLRREQVIAGHIAAEDYYSTTRSGKNPHKLLQLHNKAFTQHSLDNLSADLNSPTELTIQGFGNKGSAESKSPLLALCLHFSQEDRALQLQGLAERGLGYWTAEIFTLTTPYNFFIQQRYHQQMNLTAEQQDNKVYEEFLGDGHLPLEVISSETLLKFPSKELQRLMPRTTKPKDIKALRNLAELWRQPIHSELLFNKFKIILPSSKVSLLPQKPDQPRWDQSLLDLKFPCIGIKEFITKSNQIFPQIYLFWVNANQAINSQKFKHALDEADKKRRFNKEYSDYYPSIIITGEGSQKIEVDDERQFALLNFNDASKAVWKGDLIQGLWRRARVQLKLTTLSPFKTSGGLPPESLVFRGRNDELGFLKNRCQQASVLIIGSRRVGKTSLLNQFYAWSSKDERLEVIYLDLQGVKNGKDFLDKLRYLDDKFITDKTHLTLKKLNENPKIALESLSRQIQQQGKLALFLLNEVDGLAVNQADLIEIWRSLNDSGLARFIMTGYTVIGELGTPTSTFFHFTEGTSYGGKAIALMGLSEHSAKSILDLLEENDLKLKWRTEEEKGQAYQLLLKRSYRIPWVLQTYGRLLVEELEKQRNDVLTLNTVKKILSEKGNVVWQYIDEIKYENLIYEKDIKYHAARRSGFLILLYAIAKQRYFIGANNKRAAIEDKNLRQRNAIDLGFTVGEAYQIADDAISELAIESNEKLIWRSWLQSLDLAKTLRLLTLTLILEPDPYKNNRYGFLLHIFPLELYRIYHEKDATLDDLLANEFIEFLDLIKR